MQTFKILNPKSWAEVQPGQSLRFGASTGQRVAKVIFNTTGRTAVFMSDTQDTPHEEAILVGTGDGLFGVEVAMGEYLYLTFAVEEGSRVFYKTEVGSQARAASQTEAFTSLMPEGRRNSDFDRMVQLMKLNDLRRKEETKVERAEFEKKLRANLAAEAKAAREAEQVTEETEDETSSAGDTAAS